MPTQQRVHTNLCDDQEPAAPHRPVVSDFEAQVIARIQEILAERGLSVSTLASIAGVSQGYANRILNGKVRGSIDSLTALASAAGLGWGDLVDMVRGYSEEPRGAVFIGQRRLLRGKHMPRY